jgi:DNA-binding transcriptional LysR family regulator
MFHHANDEKMLSISLRQYEYVVAAADHGNLTAAASALRVSQPAISVALAAIEAHFVRPVFIRRHGQGVSLTSFGQAVVREARQILTQAGTIERLGDEAGPLRGQLAFGCYVDLAPFYVPALLRGFALRHPGIAVSFRTVDFETVSEQLERGAIDLALTYGLALGAAFARTTLLELPPRAMVSADHPLAARKAVSLRQLAQHPLILTDQPMSREHVLTLFATAGVDVAVTAHAGSFEFLRSMVANGHGVAVVYSCPKGDRSYDGKKIIELPISDPLPSHPILLGRLKSASLNRAALAFHDFTVGMFKARQDRASRRGSRRRQP